MMRSLFSGVTGLRSHQTKMDVIGNNISNVNTLGYKKSVTNFADLYSQTMSIASGPTGEIGGTNARQIGLGTKVNSIVIKHSPGAAQYTGNTLDVAIEGDGFFILRTNEGERYSRAGDLAVDGAGSLVNQSGFKVQAYNSVYQQGTIGKAKPTGLTTGIGTIQFDPAGTTNVGFVSDPAMVNVPSGTYTFSFGQATAPNMPAVQIYRNGVDVTDIMGPVTITKGGTAVTTTADLVNATANVQDDLEISIPAFGKIKFGIAPNSTDGAKVLSDLEDVIDNAFITVSNNDGFVSGTQRGNMEIDQELYTNFAVNERGQLIAQLKEDVTINGVRFAKNEQIVLGFLALATFTNNEGLEKVGTNMYRSSANSGLAQYGRPGEPGFGGLTPSSLEMSNVDLSEEMVGMITTQRGFQANSRIITTSDSMLEELVNLKR